MGREYDPKKTLEELEKLGDINMLGYLDTPDNEEKYEEKYDEKAEKRGTDAEYEALKIIKKYLPKTQEGIQKLVDTFENYNIDPFLAGKIVSYTVNHSPEKKIKINLHKSGWWRDLGAYQEKGKELEINGDVRLVGKRMKGGKIIVNGDGDFVGPHMKAGKIIINGDVEYHPGWESEGGTIVIKENLGCQPYSLGATIIEENSSDKNNKNVVIYHGKGPKEKFLEKKVIPKESYNRDLLVGKIEEEAEKVREELEAKFPQGGTKETYKSKVARIFERKKK